MMPYRTGHGVHRVLDPEIGAKIEDVSDYNPPRCSCGREIHTPATGDQCLSCWRQHAHQ